MTPTTTTTVATTKTVTYTVSGVTAGDLLTLTLVDSTLIDGSTFTLDTGNRTAKLTAASNVSISAINGVTLVGNDATRNFTAVGSTLTFDVVSTGGVAGSAIPVVFKRSSASDTTLNVNLAGVATENAGIGGMAKFTTAAAVVPAENPDHTFVGAEVYYINGTTSFTTDAGAPNNGSLMTLATDTYKFGATVIDKAKFYSVLSGHSGTVAGDIVDVVYVNGATASSPSSFTIQTDAFPANGFAATGVLTAPSAVGNVVTEKYTNPISTSVGGTTFDLQRAPVVTGVVGTYVSAKTGLVADYNQTTFTETVADGTYQYRMVYTAPAFSGKTATGLATATVLVPPTASTAAPALLRTYTTTNTSAVNNLSKGDVFKVVFDRAITAPVVGAKVSIAVPNQFLTYTAADSTVTGSVTFSVNTAAEVLDGASFGAGRVLTVTLLQEPITAITFAATVPTIDNFVGVGNSFGVATVPAGNGLITSS